MASTPTRRWKQSFPRPSSTPTAKQSQQISESSIAREYFAAWLAQQVTDETEAGDVARQLQCVPRASAWTVVVLKPSGQWGEELKRWNVDAALLGKVWREWKSANVSLAPRDFHIWRGRL